MSCCSARWPSIRAATNQAAASAYFEFTVSGPSEVTGILFAAETDTAAGVTVRNAMINGFEIDTPNSQKIAHTPSPADADGHVDAKYFVQQIGECQRRQRISPQIGEVRVGSQVTCRATEQGADGPADGLQHRPMGAIQAQLPQLASLAVG